MVCQISISPTHDLDARTSWYKVMRCRLCNESRLRLQFQSLDTLEATKIRWLHLLRVTCCILGDLFNCIYHRFRKCCNMANMQQPIEHDVPASTSMPFSLSISYMWIMAHTYECSGSLPLFQGTYWSMLAPAVHHCKWHRDKLLIYVNVTIYTYRLSWVQRVRTVFD